MVYPTVDKRIPVRQYFLSAASRAGIVSSRKALSSSPSRRRSRRTLSAMPSWTGRWRSPSEIMTKINGWFHKNRSAPVFSTAFVLISYKLKFVYKLFEENPSNKYVCVNDYLDALGAVVVMILWSVQSSSTLMK